MRMKLNRGKRDVFRKRNPLPKILGWVLVAAVIVCAGFFGAKWLNERPTIAPEPEDVPAATQPADTTTATTAKPQSDAAISQVRGFYLPFSALSADTLSETSLLADAKAAGYNAVIFDLKDEEGRLYYQFSNPTAKQVNSYVDNALTKKQLTALFDLIKDAGLTPIPRLHAFRDHLGAKALANARIGHASNAGWVWYDGDPNSGGKAWLNPYDQDAHAYIISLATELKKQGAGAVMLDSVQFPKQLSSANFGADKGTQKEEEALTAFVTETREALGDTCPVMLSCTAEGALGTATQVYYGNPRTFGANMLSPAILPSELPGKIKVGNTSVENTPDTLQDTVKAMVSQMILLTKVLKDDAPIVTPWLQVDGYSAAQVSAEIKGCQEGGSDCYILYSQKGDYDFGAY